MITLRGITWAHSRGYAPLAATAHVYTDFHPDVTIHWETRSLWAFGEGPLDELARQYDLLVFDYPFTGFVAENRLCLPLDEHLPAPVLAAQAAQSVGPSYQSYAYGGHQWAFPVDAAAQVSASRPDLLARLGYAVPSTWDGVLSLARATGKVGMAFSRMGTVGAFFTLCANQGEPPLRRGQPCVVSAAVGERALATLRAFYSLVDPAALQMSPVAVLNRMATTEDVAYAPLLYGYSNYARDGYAPTRLAFHNIPALDGTGCHGATLGGAGIAVSTYSPQRAVALDYLAWLTSAECQRTVYTLAQGQPGNRVAWEDELTNRVTHNFFRDTLPTLDQAYLRPNAPAFHAFQTRAGDILHAFLQGAHGPAETLAQLNAAYAHVPDHHG